MKRPNAQTLLAALKGSSADDDLPEARPAAPMTTVAAEPVAEVTTLPPAPSAKRAGAKPAARGQGKAPRAELKHIGGYLDDETVEKVALLRIRLKLENSALLKLAIDDLFRKHSAKRAFGDA